MIKVPYTSGLIVLSLLASAAFGQPEVKIKPLRWHQVAIGDGGELYLELCAVCHGPNAKGDGPAAPALKKPVPDLTLLASKNQGVFPVDQVAKTISGEHRIESHGSVDMPMWGQAFAGVRPDWKQFHREAFARQKIYNLTEYLESVQVQ